MTRAPLIPLVNYFKYAVHQVQNMLRPTKKISAIKMQRKVLKNVAQLAEV